MIMPDRNDTAAVVIITNPSPLIVHIRLMLTSVVIAHPSSSAHTSVPTNATPDPAVGGGSSRHSPRPITGRSSDAISTIGTARSTVGAVRSAIARMYHKLYR